jgi:uncharacterized membrane protein (UPF0127 family)
MTLPRWKLRTALLAISLLPFLAGCASSTHAPQYTPSASATASLVGDGQAPLRTVVAEVGQSTVVLGVADDPDERTDGLSRRNGLSPETGMLFVWDSEEIHTLWMKDMRFALDLVWLDADRTVVHIERDVQPQPGAADSELVRYASQSPAKYAIELAAGEADRLGIRSGDVIQFDESAD